MSKRVFGVTDATRLALVAVEGGVIRDANAEEFAGWLADTYDGEDTDYVESLSLSTLWGRYLEGGKPPVTVEEITNFPRRGDA